MTTMRKYTRIKQNQLITLKQSNCDRRKVQKPRKPFSAYWLTCWTKKKKPEFTCGSRCSTTLADCTSSTSPCGTSRTSSGVRHFHWKPNSSYKFNTEGEQKRRFVIQRTVLAIHRKPQLCTIKYEFCNDF